MRIITEANPFPPASMPGYPQPPAGYACRWVWHPEAVPGDAAVMAFRLPFSLDDAQTTRVHVSADQRYELYLDGERLGRGPTRGDLGHWHYESYDLHLSAGEHLLAACVWWLPEDGAPMAQMSGDPGFLLLAEGPLHAQLSTGAAPWVVSPIDGYEGTTASVGSYMVVGWSFTLDGHQYPWGWQTAGASGGLWMPACAVAVPIGQASHPCFEPETSQRRPQHHLIPADIPAMIEVERSVGTVRHARSLDAGDGLALQAIDPNAHDVTLAEPWQQLLTSGGSVVVEPHTRLRILIDLDDYYCAYPELVTSGGDGASVALGWSESLYTSTHLRDHRKGNRDEVADKLVRGPYDRFLLEGGAQRVYSTLWWRAGRYVDLVVQTEEAPLTLHTLGWRETRYPLEMQSTLETDDPSFDRVRPLMFRTLQMCAHETYFDCPYYEQLMYAGDTRLEILATYVATHDDRLPARACRLFDQSRSADGLTKSRYPSAVPQVIPPFSLWWVSMVHDHWMWRRRHDQVKRWLPGIHTVLAAFEQRLNADDLVEAPRGWNFCDWVPEWNAGWPPDARIGVSALLNLQYVYALDRAAELFAHLGQPDIARHWQQVRRRVATAVARRFWVPARGLLADDAGGTRFSEHTQCLALLCDLLEGDDRRRVIDGLLTAPGLARTTVYFSHYWFEALYHVGALAQADQRLSFWRSLPDLGLKTVLEQPEPSRSDCHAWGAHPLYHAYASFLGARPSAPGFGRIRIAPQPGPFGLLRGSLPDAQNGWIRFDLRAGAQLQGTVTLPPEMEGDLLWQGDSLTLRPGENQIALG